MGMDVIAKKDGVDFHANVWSWHPLWTVCEAIAPRLFSKVRYARSNDGDGLDGADSLALADALDVAIASGDIEEALRADSARKEALPDETCIHCAGRGYRTDPVAIANPHLGLLGGCNGCHGTGRVRPLETHYGVDIETLRRFSSFLRLCGGFEIW